MQVETSNTPFASSPRDEVPLQPDALLLGAGCVIWGTERRSRCSSDSKVEDDQPLGSASGKLAEVRESGIAQAAPYANRLHGLEHIMHTQDVHPGIERFHS